VVCVKITSLINQAKGNTMTAKKKPAKKKTIAMVGGKEKKVKKKNKYA